MKHLIKHKFPSCDVSLFIHIIEDYYFLVANDASLMLGTKDKISKEKGDWHYPWQITNSLSLNPFFWCHEVPLKELELMLDVYTS